MRFSTLREKVFRLKHIPHGNLDTQLRRCLTTVDITLLGIGHMIGAGIYVLTAVARSWSGYLDSLLGNVISNTTMERVGRIENSSFFGDYPDIIAFLLIVVVAIFIALGSKVSTNFNSVFTIVNMGVHPTAAFSDAFALRGATVAKIAVSVGALCGMTTSLVGGMFALPRCVYAMAEDGLLFSSLAVVNGKTQVPINAVLVFGSITACIALLFDIETLVEFLSIGTLLAYSIVSACVIILRYQPARYPEDGSFDNGGKMKFTFPGSAYLEQFDPGHAVHYGVVVMMIGFTGFGLCLSSGTVSTSGTCSQSSHQRPDDAPPCTDNLATTCILDGFRSEYIFHLRHTSFSGGTPAIITRSSLLEEQHADEPNETVYAPKHLDRFVTLSMKTLADNTVPKGEKVVCKSESPKSCK
ncbi:hypothetical protein TELCIR_07731 [Teladorsagia circumcincta]|uniref:Amino acid permease n=1 Tax=Teladorsagia circumcincta TaxID=45464 RepID=A0A2G9UJJ0_TELCI|nr:hypothetical protein TELCIR_07731 [Teladorsagia circumcincta]